MEFLACFQIVVEVQETLKAASCLFTSCNNKCLLSEWEGQTGNI